MKYRKLQISDVILTVEVQNINSQIEKIEVAGARYPEALEKRTGN